MNNLILRMPFSRRAALFLLPVLAMLLPTACTGDEEPTEKATVTMTFTTRATTSGSPEMGIDLEARERMQTLRVIVVRTETSQIMYNLLYDQFDTDDTQNGRYYKTITFGELTIKAEGEDFDFYAIANEEGIGYSGKWNNISFNDLQNLIESNSVLNTDALTEMNNKDGSSPIPQTGHTRIKVQPTIQEGKVELDFVVAKVRLTVKNTSAVSQTVSNIRIGGINQIGTPLFASQSLATESDGNVSLNPLSVPASTADSNGEANAICYVYENSGGNYQLTANWPDEMTRTIINIRDKGITQIPRGTMLHITVTLATNAEVQEFNVGIVSWKKSEMDVEFN